jgi:hypothetical protein
VTDAVRDYYDEEIAMSKGHGNRGGSGNHVGAGPKGSVRGGAPVPNLPSTTGRPSGRDRGNAPAR